MKEVVELVQIDFDNLENNYSDAVCYKTLAAFEEGDGLTAYGKAAKWLSTQPPVKLYLGHDCNIYPRIVFKSISVI